MSTLTQQFTEIRFKNCDGDALFIKKDFDDTEAVMITINAEEFWFYKDDAKQIAEALLMLADRGNE